MNIILFGPPGAGKGTQAQKLVENHNYYQISTGDLLRNEANKKSNIGVEIEKLISKGEFVSDEIVNDLLKQTLSKLNSHDPIIFDGYPRSISQASNLEQILISASDPKIHFRSYFDLNFTCFSTVSFEIPITIVFKFSNSLIKLLNDIASFVHPVVSALGKKK